MGLTSALGAEFRSRRDGLIGAEMDFTHNSTFVIHKEGVNVCELRLPCQRRHDREVPGPEVSLINQCGDGIVRPTFMKHELQASERILIQCGVRLKCDC